MTLRQLALLYFRARLISWLFGTHQFVYIGLQGGVRVNLAAFCNGRYHEAPAESPFPDIVPPEWQEKPPGEAPGEAP